MADYIYPPILPSTISAVYTSGTSEDIKLYFTHNALNQKEDMGHITYKITTITGEQKGLAKHKNCSINEETGEGFVNLQISSDMSLEPYNYYKLYLAYSHADSGLIKSPYSNPTTFLFLGNADLSVSLEQSKDDLQVYIGKYLHQKALKEKEFSYQFILSDNLGNVLEDTGILYHDFYKNETYDQFYLNYELPSDEIYTLQYIVTTVNQINLTTSMVITNTTTLTSSANLYQYTFDYAPKEECCNSLNGTISIKIQPRWLNFESELKIVTGSYKLLQSNENNPNIWQTVTTFNLDINLVGLENSLNYIDIFTDFSAVSGLIYNYKIVQYNSYGIQSIPIGGIQQYSVTFEGNFLGDGKRQLNVNFNPQMSSFKTNILQSKTETIGSKYPWINRNGVVNYKEFPLSGLISYHSDPNYLFISEEEAKSLQIYDYDRVRKYTPSGQEEHISNRTFNLSDINFKAEQYFKLKVLDFLNDGNVKLFRSATEGNYFVRIMNVSLTPQQTLGRMLHTFSCTAYEVEEINKENIKPFLKLAKGFDETNLLTTNIIHSPKSIFNLSINEIFRQKGVFVGRRKKTYAKAVDIEGPPGAVLEFLLQKGYGEFNETNTMVIRKIIGVTGKIRVDMDSTPYYIVQIGMPYQGKDDENKSHNFGLVNNSLTMVEIKNEIGDTPNNFLSNHFINFVLFDWYVHEKPDFECLKRVETQLPAMKVKILDSAEINDFTFFNGELQWDSKHQDQIKNVLKKIYLFRLTNMLETEAQLKYYVGQWDRSNSEKLCYPEPVNIIVPGYSEILLWGPELDMAVSQGYNWPEIIRLKINDNSVETKVQCEFIYEQAETFYSNDYDDVLPIETEETD